MKYEDLLDQVAVIHADIIGASLNPTDVLSDQRQLEAFVDEYASECHLDEDPAWNRALFIDRLFRDYMSL